MLELQRRKGERATMALSNGENIQLSFLRGNRKSFYVLANLPIGLRIHQEQEGQLISHHGGELRLFLGQRVYFILHDNREISLMYLGEACGYKGSYEFAIDAPRDVQINRE